MENSTDTGKVIGALLVGAALGGALGILFAPDKGSRTRRKLMAKGNDLTDSIRDKFDEFLEGVKEQIDTMKEKASEYMDNGSPKNEKQKAHA